MRKAPCLCGEGGGGVDRRALGIEKARTVAFATGSQIIKREIDVGERGKLGHHHDFETMDLEPQPKRRQRIEREFATALEPLGETLLHESGNRIGGSEGGTETAVAATHLAKPGRLRPPPIENLRQTKNRRGGRR